jgi:acetylornithine deacetylase/succinyl-diaminopimelate desuccinylase-like protein
MIIRYLRRHQERYLNELRKFIRFPSVSAQPKHAGDVRACAQWLAEHFRRIGLRATVHKTAGHPIVEARTKPRVDQPTVVVYGHYDVQAPEPFGLWNSPPFELTVRGRQMFARGSADDKAPVFAHIKAVEAYLRTGTPLPVNVVFLIEGEEEVGSTALVKFCQRHARRLRADYVVASDTSMFAKNVPTLTYATRGIAGLEVRIDGPSRDMHSGLFGGSFANPAMELSKLLAGCVDARGHITIPGFYDDVRPLQAWERRMWAKLPFGDEQYAKFIGVRAVTGERGFTTLERRWARPTFEINGITGGYQGEGGKTIVPAWASAKITCRLVPDQDFKTITRLVARHLRRQCPKTVRITVTPDHGGPPFLTSTDGPGARAALAALESAFGRKPVMTREGGAIPILDVLRRHLHGEILLLGLILPDCDAHSPNEKMDLDNFYRGIAMSADLLRRLGTESGRHSVERNR